MGTVLFSLLTCLLPLSLTSTRSSRLTTIIHEDKCRSQPCLLSNGSILHPVPAKVVSHVPACYLRVLTYAINLFQQLIMTNNILHDALRFFVFGVKVKVLHPAPAKDVFTFFHLILFFSINLHSHEEKYLLQDSPFPCLRCSGSPYCPGKGCVSSLHLLFRRP